MNYDENGSLIFLDHNTRKSTLEDPRALALRSFPLRAIQAESNSESDKSSAAYNLLTLKYWIERCAIEHPACQLHAYDKYLEARHAESKQLLERLRKPKVVSRFGKVKGMLSKEAREKLEDDRQSEISAQDIPPLPCRRTEDVIRQWYPTRMIDVGLAGEPVRLVLGSNCSDNSGPYLTLSHCWGPPEHITKTTQENIKSHFHEVAFETLPKTFQDAIIVTRDLEVRYLWIDSLCIIQGDKEDWAREAGQMSKVYTQAFCTLAASASKNGHGGLFQPRTLDMYDCHLLYRDEDGSKVRVIITHHTEQAEANVKSMPLSTRGWTLQERALSQRILHFTEQAVVFECRTGMASETQPEQMYDRTNYSYQRAIRNVDPVSELDDPTAEYESDVIRPLLLGDPYYFKGSLSGNNTDLQYIFRTWYELVSQFTNRNLTHQSDKLPAISGIAHAFEPWIGGRYLAGIWEEDLLNGLMWRACCPLPQPKRQHRRYPTWSWASLDGCVRTSWEYNQIYSRKKYRDGWPADYESSDVTIVLSGFDSMGQVQSGSLTISGHIFEADYVDSGQGRRDPYIIFEEQKDHSYYEIPYEDLPYYKTSPEGQGPKKSLVLKQGRKTRPSGSDRNGNPIESDITIGNIHLDYDNMKFDSLSFFAIGAKTNGDPPNLAMVLTKSRGRYERAGLLEILGHPPYARDAEDKLGWFSNAARVKITIV